MTREEALNILKDCELNPCVPQDKEAVNLAIKALEQEPCEDCVSRQAVLEYIEGSDAELGHSSENELVCQDIKELPPVTPTKCIATVKFNKEDIQELVDEKMKDIVVERKKGKWIFTKTIFDKYGCTVECPSCHKKWKTYDEIRWKKENKYCPNCGAEMEGGE